MSKPPTRRAAITAGLVAGCAGASRAPRAFRPIDDVITYEAFGDHRTGTDADVETAQWLAARLSASGFDTRRRPFAVNLFALEGASVTAGGREIEAFPLWPATELRLHGKLGDDDIALVTLPYSANATLASSAYRTPLVTAAGRARAIVAITEGPTNEIIALNVESDHPLAVPTLLVGGRDGEYLRAASRDQQAARLQVSGRSLESAAYNVIAARSGRGPTIVVSTPISGWFGCAGERGAGIAVFLALAAWARSGLANPLVFVATSGHEFEGLGSRNLFEHDMPPPENTALWLHLGANLANYAVRFENGAPLSTGAISPTRYAGASASLLTDVARVFAGQTGYDRPFDLAASATPGDVAIYRDRGYANLVGLVGANPLHHTRHDRAQFVAPQALNDIIASLRSLLSALGDRP